MVPGSSDSVLCEISINCSTDVGRGCKFDRKLTAPANNSFPKVKLETPSLIFKNRLSNSSLSDWQLTFNLCVEALVLSVMYNRKIVSTWF